MESKRGKETADDYDFAVKVSVAETMPSSLEKVHMREYTPSASQDNNRQEDDSNMTSVMSNTSDAKMAKKPTFDDKRES